MKIKLLLAGYLFLASLSYSQSVDISTANKRVLNKNLFHACAVDISFSGSAATPRMKDVTYGQWKTTCDSLHLTGYNYSGGSTADHDHCVIGDTMIYGGRGTGYNCHDCYDLDGICCAYIPKDFFNEFTVFSRGEKVGIIANMQTGSWDELKWKIERTNAYYVIMGLEQNLMASSSFFPTAKDYVTRSNSWSDSVRKYFPGVYIISDAPPSDKDTRRNLDFRKEIGNNSNADAVRAYAWDNDLVGLVSRDWDENLRTVNTAWNTTFPNWLKDYQQDYPEKDVMIAQWGIKKQEGNTTGLDGTVLGQMFIAKGFSTFVANDDIIKVASFMSLKSLIGSTNLGTGNYWVVEKIGDWVRSVDSVVSITVTSLPGVTVLAGVTGKDYSMLVINDNSYSVSVPKINVDGNWKKKKAVTTESLYGESLSTTALLLKTYESTGSFEVPQYSVSVVKMKN